MLPPHIIFCRTPIHFSSFFLPQAERRGATAAPDVGPPRAGATPGQRVAAGLPTAGRLDKAGAAHLEAISYTALGTDWSKEAPPQKATAAAAGGGEGGSWRLQLVGGWHPPTPLMPTVRGKGCYKQHTSGLQTPWNCRGKAGIIWHATVPWPASRAKWERCVLRAETSRHYLAS